MREDMERFKAAMDAYMNGDDVHMWLPYEHEWVPLSMVFPARARFKKLDHPDASPKRNRCRYSIDKHLSSLGEGEKGKIIALRKAGWSVVDISHDVHAHPSTIWAVVHRAGLR